MTRDPHCTRRGLLQSTAIGATPLSVVGQLNTDGETDTTEAQTDARSVPKADLIEDYLGVTALSYDDPKGELTYRITDDEPDCSEDCVYRIGQTVVVQDSDASSHDHHAEDIIVDAQFELQLTASDAARLPTFYREFESKFGTEAVDDDDDALSTSQLSFGSYPGLLTRYDESVPDDSSDDLNVVWYVQSLPWGMLYWDIIYDPAASVALEVDAYQEWLRRRKPRDWDLPSLATKSHWKEVHLGGSTGKARYHGDISGILRAAPGFENAELEQTNKRLWKTSGTDQPAAVTLNTYR